MGKDLEDEEEVDIESYTLNPGKSQLSKRTDDALIDNSFK